jgi:hypothetical protein
MAMIYYSEDVDGLLDTEDPEYCEEWYIPKEYSDWMSLTFESREALEEWRSKPLND